MPFGNVNGVDNSRTTSTSTSSATSSSNEVAAGRGGGAGYSNISVSTGAIEVLAETAPPFSTTMTNYNNNDNDHDHDHDGMGNGGNGGLSRFGALAASVEASVRSLSVKSFQEEPQEQQKDGSKEGALVTAVTSSQRKVLHQLPFYVTPAELGELSSERTLQALVSLLEKAVDRSKKAVMKLTASANESSIAGAGGGAGGGGDLEAPAESLRLQNDVMQLISQIRVKMPAGDDDHHHHNHDDYDEHSPEARERVRQSDLASALLTTWVLRSSPEQGIDASEVEYRRAAFGSNAIAEKELDSFLKLCWEAVQDFVLIMLLILGVIGIAMELGSLEDGEKCGPCWIEGAAIMVSVCIVVLVTASIDYAKQFAFIRLTKSLHETNTKSVIRNGGQQMLVTDDDIVVGDILSVNSHNMASIPADCILLGPPGAVGDLKVDESSLTGESVMVSKRPGDVVLSGTTAVVGSGKMVVIAVGIYSVAGRIKARVYDSKDHKESKHSKSGDLAESEDDDVNDKKAKKAAASSGGGDNLDGDDVNSPLFVKLETLAQKIGVAGSMAALLAFGGSCILGLLVDGEDPDEIPEYLMTAITVLAVAVPEGLPLAVTLALAFSSNKMMSEQNLVKHLDACETMGCATTICTDKTGTLTANKMTARAIYTGGENYLVDDPATTLGEYVLSTKQGGLDAASANKSPPSSELVEITCQTIAIDTMNETVCDFDQNGVVTASSGNPTEVALLHLVHDLGHEYKQIRNSTKGRSDQGSMAEYLSMGKQYDFSSARKMMSWAIPIDGTEDGGYRIFTKGASEVVLTRCTEYLDISGQPVEMTDEARAEFQETAFAYARRGMRCLLLAYRDLPAGFDLDGLCHNAPGSDDEGDNPTPVVVIANSDGSAAYEAETNLVAIALVGIEDPLRPEVPGAIAKCYRAGIDVRLVTGDSPNTAVSIAYQAGILRDFHFREFTSERVAENLKTNVLMEGREFRRKVYLGEGPNKEFSQTEFDKIWPYLRVLARSSPDDKLTLAHGLNQSNLFADQAFCRRLEAESGIKIFPDRQVVAMTGDGTNDAPALKRADIGFAMGISGTQIAKDAADIILIDDNFASIVTAAKWGRNVYASIQKFLQFQLTVNIAAVVTALVGAFWHQKSPLAAIQLLWVNLLMDSLASLALASEPPVDELLEKPPVNRTDSMITKHMWANMLGHATYQITVVMTLLFKGPDLLDLEAGHIVEERGVNSVHYTIIFNAFVWMQLFNEVNCRKLKGEFNVFKGILQNRLFCGILIVTAIMQFIIVEFGSVAFHVADGGIKLKYWGLCMAIGAGSLPVQQVINVLYRFGQQLNLSRNSARVEKDRQMVSQRVASGHEHNE